jgi:hypothetical protein
MTKSNQRGKAIHAFFDAQPTRVFASRDFDRIRTESAAVMGLSQNMNAQRFLEMLLRVKKFRKVTLRSESYANVDRYVWGNDTSLLTITLSLRRDAYLSHGSAMLVHGLGGSALEIFVNKEQTEKSGSNTALTQDGLDRAFRNVQRQSKMVYHLSDARITLLNGKNTGRLGVELRAFDSDENIDVTSLERTLIDITVRPAYAGGVQSVVDAFKSARGHALIPRLLELLNTLDYVYPYHQAIGFYLSRADFTEADLQPVRRIERSLNFYLCHGIKDLAYDRDWKVFFPKALE